MRRIGKARPWAGIVPDASGVEFATTEVARRVENLAEAQRQCKPNDYRFVTAISGADVWCHTLTLPSTDAKELSQMVRLQMDDLSPLPAEETVCGFLPLERTETGTRVLLAIAPKATVDEHVAALETAGLPAQIVSVDALAVFRHLARRNLLPQDDLLHLFVRLEAGRAAVIGFTRGQPLIVRSLMVSTPDELMGEIRHTRLAMELDQPGAAFGGVIFAGAGDEWREKLGASARHLGADEVPAVAAALCTETTAEHGESLNLLSDEWRERRQKAQTRRSVVRGGLAVVGLYMLGLAVFGAVWLTEQWRLGDLNRQCQRLQPQFTEAREARNTLSALEARFDTQQTALEVLREMSLLIPENVRLNGFGFKKGQSVTIRGETSTAPKASEFIGRLERCPLFRSVKTLSMPTMQDGLTKFEVVCSLKSAARPAGAKQ